MADPEHVDILKRGVDKWNAWREANPAIRPNLTEAALPGANLAGANLTFANLFGIFAPSVDLGHADLSQADMRMANLQDANMQQADLYRAALCGSQLQRAVLTGCHCNGADMTWANLTDADLSHASLWGTQLSHSQLSGTDFDKAKLGDINFADTDLSQAKSLESATLEYPCVLDYRTLARSPGLPLSFLRGCGLPDSLIDYLPSLLSDPLVFYSCFISYSSVDEAFVRRLHADLQDAGVRCWFAPDDLKIGDKLRLTFDEQIRLHDKLLLVLSNAAISSQWVEAEVEGALARERSENRTVLFPVRLDDDVFNTPGWPSLICSSRHIGDFREWQNDGAYQSAFERLLRDLRGN